MKQKKHRETLPPGSVVFKGDQKVDRIGIHYLKYDAEHLTEQKLDNHTEITFLQSASDTVDWYDIRGLHDTRLIETLGKTFEIHPLIQEDIVDTDQRPKFEEYEKGLFLVIRALSFEKNQEKMNVEHVTIYFKKGLVVTFQETESDLFESVRKRLQARSGKIRTRGADYLVYALADVLVDQYYFMLEDLEEVISRLEEELLDSSDDTMRERIHHIKRTLIGARKSITPLREAVNRFAKSENEIILEGTKVFLRDLYDHTIQVMDMVENYRDMLNGLQDLHLSEISYKMNQVMQVLTIITTVFVPLSFLVGLYGMNFDNMPELHYKYGYFMLWGFMLIIALGLLAWFRRKRWL